MTLRNLVFAVCGFLFCNAVPAAAQPLMRPAAGTYDVVALRVEFQPDTSRFTTGDGTFAGDIYGGLEPKVDPLPHDAAYFQAHLDFLANYVDRVSNGRVDVRLHLLSDVVRVPQPMGAYAPVGPDSDSEEELRKLAGLVRDAWTRADDSDVVGLTPGRTAFLIFHAGVGRDIELIGTTLDKTPQDLPSLFFDQAALNRHLGGDALEFGGIPIDNALILPRTESRLGTDFIADEKFLLELSINGLLAASFFNFLGVPDLFDTERGESAIGPFGLMDPQGIFAYRGLFPPEPMAWTKQFLGWSVPVDLQGAGPTKVSLRAASLQGSSESARAIVSGAEYFLIENRHRDPEGDGLTLRVWQRGEVVEQHVENGDPEFNSFVIDAFIGGVVVDVDNYDWALPGGLDEDDNELNGGILIWHVDERRLAAGLPANRVNIGTTTRAIDLEEADSAQDIGFPSTGPFGPQAELGTPFDFFYRGNPVAAVTQTGQEIRLYRNRFGPDTHPSSATNGGGPSFVVIEDFSEPSAEMTFTYALSGVHGIEPLDIDFGLTGPTYGPGSGISRTEDDLVVYSSDGSTALLQPATLVAVSSKTYPSSTNGLGHLREINGKTAFVQSRNVNGVLLDEQVVPLPAEIQQMEPISPIVYTSFDRGRLYSFLMRGEGRTAVVEVGQDGVRVNSEPSEHGAVSIAAVRTDQGSIPVVIGRRSTALEGKEWTYDLGNAHTGQAVIGFESGSYMIAIPVIDRGEVWLLLPDGDVQIIDVASSAVQFGVAQGDSLAAYPVLADFDGDFLLDVLVPYGNLLFAYSRNGAVVQNFPIRVPGKVVSQPLVARFAGESAWSLIATAADGYVYAYETSERQRLRIGFPLEAGNSAPATPLLDQDTLYAVSEGGTLKAWRLADVDSVLWGQLHGGSGNESFLTGDDLRLLDVSPPPVIASSETYNWPNPITGGITNLRIKTGYDARVSVTIIDAAGSRVADFDLGEVRGGSPKEVVWQADVASGLYFARFTATTTDGETATRLVKMAVIR